MKHPRRGKLTLGASLYNKFVSSIGSAWFFWIVVAIFVLQALWIAFSFRYPMLFDEHYHFTLIQLFSHRLSPIIINQPPSYDVFGDLGHSGSTLYHYLMSFPYRLVAHFTQTLFVQVVALRIINVILFASGIILFARLFEKLKVQRSLINVTMLFFVLLPIVPYLAATINYDNMLFLLVAWFVSVCAKVFSEKQLSWKTYTLIILLGCAATLVKFAFAPIFLTAVLYVGIFTWRRQAGAFVGKFVKSVKASNKFVFLSLSILTLFVVVWFSQIYLLNVVKYHNPQPSCSRSLSASRCSKSPVNQSAMYLKTTKDQRSVSSLPDAIIGWAQSMEYNLNITSVNLHNDGTGTMYARPLPIIYFMTFVLSFGGIAVLLYAWRSMKRPPLATFFMVIVMVYALSVFCLDIQSYYGAHEFVAVQPRYLIQVLPLILILMALAANFVMRKHRYLKVGTLLLTFCFYLNGAGVITHIIRSNPTWYWQRPKVIKANETAQRLLKPFVVEKSNL